tara:strand:+ start:2514 stop:3215 length:702 start_codon:yes stop_codon:yes gene_type:complete
MRVLLTGGNGLLGRYLIKELIKSNISFYAPTSNECDIIDLSQINLMVFNYKPDIVIHCAAIAKYKDVELDPQKALRTNVEGTCNITNACMTNNTRLVYISTSHIFDGQKGNYTTSDPINPLTKYAKTKAAGEYTVGVHDNSLIIRTEFCEPIFPFEYAYIDKWSSKEYVDILAPQILNACLSSQKGIIHLGGKRKTFYDFALIRNPKVKKGSIEDIKKTSKVPILVDTSLVSS